MNLLRRRLLEYRQEGGAGPKSRCARELFVTSTLQTAKLRIVPDHGTIVAPKSGADGAGRKVSR